MKVEIGPYVDGDDEDREIDIIIDDYDTWSMDHTLALIALPMLKQLKKTKHGAPFVDNEDVPEYLRMPEGWYDEKYRVNGETDPHFFDRWDWVMDQMIFAMKNLADNDWEEQFWKEHPEIDWEAPGEEVVWIKHGECDWDGRKEYADRIQRGCELFGKYFQNLWD